MFIKFKLEAGFGKKKGLRRLAGSELTYEEAPPPQKAEAPAFVPPEPQPRRTQQAAPVKPLRLRANMSVREVAKLLKDKRIQRVVGKTEAGFYERYASSNYSMAELAEHVGTTDEVGVRVYAERIENTIVREALGLKLITGVEPPPKDGDAQYERLREEETRLAGKDLVKQDRRLRKEKGVKHGIGFKVEKPE